MTDPSDLNRPAQGPDGEGMPLWVKLFGGVFLLVVIVVVVLHLMGRGMGGHG